MKREFENLKENKEGLLEDLEVGKERRKWWDFIIISKIIEIKRMLLNQRIIKNNEIVEIT